MNRSLKALAVLAAAGCLAVAAGTAIADAVPSATYNGVSDDGAGVSLRISPDGTLVEFFKITGAHGDTCMFDAEFDTGAWSGAPINNNSFDYQVGDGVLFRGTFTGPQSASGTYRFSHPSSGSPSSACDTGIVGWTATTTARPSSGDSGGSNSSGGGGGGSGGGGNGNGMGGAGSGHVASFTTRVVLHKSPKKLGGWLKTASRACRARRTVILWIGDRRLARTTSTAKGTFSFPRSARTKGHPVRASVTTRRVSGGICAAGSSTFVHA